MFENVNFLEATRVIFEVLIAPFAAITAYLYNGLKNEMKEVKTDLINLELDVSKIYLTKTEFKEFEHKIFSRLDDQHTDLSGKLDKLDNRLFNLVSVKSLDNN